MTRLEFRNRLCILRSIDEDELRSAGIKLSDKDWLSFCLDPFRFFLKMDDETAEKLWRLIERWAISISIDWSSASEATAALNAGILPPGCSIDTDGALIIPDSVHSGGSSVVLARFDRIVTVSGRIVKDRDGALKTTRAL